MNRLLIVLTAWMLAMPASFAAPPEGRGRPEDPGAQGQGQDSAPGQQDRGEQGQAQAEVRSEVRAEQAEARTEARTEARPEQASAQSERAAERTALKSERAAVQAEAGNERAEARAANAEHQERQQERRELKHADTDTGVEADGRHHRAAEHRRNPEEHGREAAHGRVASLVDSLNRLDHARWNYNPHDTRGQGNMGRPDMRDPFGFDKDSGREGRDRGRPIRESEPTEPPAEEPPVTEDGGTPAGVQPALSLADLVVADFSSLEAYEQWILDWFQYVMNWYAFSPYLQSYYTYQQWYDMWYNHFFIRTDTSTGIIINQRETMDYSLTFTGSGTYNITTELVSLQDYSSTHYEYIYDQATGTSTYLTEPVQYSQGEVILQQSQEVTINSDSSTFSYSYDLPDSLTGSDWSGGLYTQLRVTVTDTTTGESSIMSYDKSLYLYRCPYGIVYDKQSGKPIANAIVTVHNVDGSVAVLDKASNPDVSNPQTTDATGRYNCKLAIGKKYYLTVKAPGYQEYRSPLFSERWHIVREDVALTPVSAQPASGSSSSPHPPAPLDAEMRNEVRPGTGFLPGFIHGK